MAANIWFVESTMIVELQTLTDKITGEVVTTATVQATLVDERDAPVLGVSWPIALVHAEDGTYRGSAPATAAVVDKGKYTCRIRAQVDGISRRWDIPVVARIDNN